MAFQDARGQFPKVGCPDMRKIKAVWDQNRDTIYRLFILEDLTLKGVKRALETENGFPEFRLRDYEVILRDYFGFRKNLKSQDWQSVALHRERILLRGERCDVYLYGRLLEKARVDRAVRRSKHKWKLPYRVYSDSVPPLPDGITIQTPSNAMQSKTLSLPGNNASAIHVPQVLSARPLAQSEPWKMDNMPAMANIGWPAPITLSVQEMRLHVPFTQFIEITAMAIYKLVMPTPNLRSSPGASQLPVMSGLPQVVKSLGFFPQNQIPGHTSTLSGPLRATLERHLQNRVVLRSIRSLSETFSFERIMYLFSTISNKRSVSKSDSIELLDWIESAEIDVLKSLFALPSSTVAATWEALMELQAIMTRPVAFTKLVEVGLLMHDGQWIKARAGDVLSLAIWHKLGDLTQRLLSQGVSPNVKVTGKYVHIFRTSGGEVYHVPLIRSPLTVAVLCTDPQAVTSLLAYGADINAFDAGIIFHHYISLYPEKLEQLFHCLRLLLEAGAYVDVRIDQWRKPVSPLGKFGWSEGEPCWFLDILWQNGHSHEYWNRIFDLAAQYSHAMKTSLTVAGLCKAASLGQTELQDYMSVRADPSGTDRTLILEVALSAAASKGDWNACKSLLQIGVDPNAENYCTQFRRLHNGPYCKDLTGKLARWRVGELTPIFGALKRADLFLLELLLEAGTDLNRHNLVDALLFGIVYEEDWARLSISTNSDNQHTGSHIPAATGLAPEKVEQIFDTLTRAGLDVRVHGGEAMAKAVQYDQSAEVSVLQCNWLHSKGIDWDIEVVGCNLLHFAVGLWSHWTPEVALDMVKFLVARGVNVHSTAFHEGYPLLHDAIRRGCRIGVIDFLLNHGADVHCCSQQGLTALQQVFECNWNRESAVATCIILLQAGAPLVSPELSTRHRARSDVLGGLMALPEIDDSLLFPLLETVVSTQLRYDADIATELQDGYHKVKEGRLNRLLSPLQGAITARRFDMAKELLRRGSDERYMTSPLVTALQVAVEICLVSPENCAAAEFMTFLISSGLNINAHAGNGLTALHRASAGGSLNIASLLLENGADPNKLARKVHFRLVKREEAGGRKSYNNQSYHGLFYRAPSEEDFDPDEIHEYDEDGNALFMQPCIPCIETIEPVWATRPLDLAAITGRLDMVQMLLNAGGISGHSRTGPYDGAIDCAIEHQHYAVASLLQKASLELRDSGFFFNESSAYYEGSGYALR